jgi:hypothetical protein
VLKGAERLQASMQSLTFISSDDDDSGPLISGLRSGWLVGDWQGVVDVVHGFAGGVAE